MTMPKRKPSPWPRGVRTKVYDAMRLEYYRAGGAFYEMSDSLKEELGALAPDAIEEAQELRSEAWFLYTGEARARLDGMIAVVALVEDRDEEAVRKEVEP